MTVSPEEGSRGEIIGNTEKLTLKGINAVAAPATVCGSILSQNSLLTKINMTV